MATAELNERQTAEWIHGAIRRQGSVMGEMGVERVFDFASLWTIADGTASFDGWSVSVCDGRGKYDGNISDSQENLLKKIREAAPYFSTDVAERQKRFIEKAIAPLYEGKMGIDMMADTQGRIYPCVEINLRRTMGHVAMDSFNRSIFVN